MPPGRGDRRVTVRERHAAERRRARRVGLAGFVAAAAMPALLWHGVVAEVASGFRLELSYLTGWVPWALIAGGLLFLAPVALSAGRDPESRLYPRARNAYAGWGVTLYLLGCALATQVAQLTDGVAAQ